MNTPYPIEPQQPPRATRIVLPSHQVEPTICEPDPDTNVVISNPYKVRLDGVWWLLDRGYAVRSDLFEFHGPYLDESTSEAADRYYMWRHLSRVDPVERVAEIVKVDRHRRTAITENGDTYPGDLSLECLLSLAGEGSVAYAVRIDNGYCAYRVDDAEGNLAAISPWTRKWQDWYEGKIEDPAQ